MEMRLASIDLDECIERLYKKELLADSVVEAICSKAKELLMKESNVVHIAAPVTVVGDIHGQFFDMIEIFKIGGFCPNTNYLFLGIAPFLFLAFLFVIQICFTDARIPPSFRRLRRPRPIQRRNHLPPRMPQATIPRTRASDPRKPRIARRDAVIRLLH